MGPCSIQTSSKEEQSLRRLLILLLCNRTPASRNPSDTITACDGDVPKHSGLVLSAVILGLQTEAMIGFGGGKEIIALCRALHGGRYFLKQR